MQKKKWHCLKRSEISENDYLIRAVQENDIENIRVWRNLQIDVLRQKGKISKSEQADYFNNNVFSNMYKDQPLNILMSYFHKDELIGYGGLVHLNWIDKRAEISFLLEPSLTNDKEIYKKHHLNFLKLISDLAFKDLNFNKIFTETWSISNRKNHIKNLEEFGFILEGRLKSHVLVDRKFRDALIHRILYSEYT